MQFRVVPIARVLVSILLVYSLSDSVARAQGMPATPVSAQDEDIVRVNAELVQTDVMVFDKQGQFIDGLKPEQFELKIDGKVVPISFFERVVAGSVDEDAQLAAARGGSIRPASVQERPAGVRPLDRGRVIIFFVDDLHLSAASTKRTRDTLLRFIKDEMGQNDQAVVTSASGQIGFLQQLTSEKSVLRKAVALLNYRSYNVRDNETPPMSEHQAVAVENRDFQVVDFFVEQLLKSSPGMRRDMAENMVAQRASQILQQANAVSVNTLSSLESLIRNAAQIPGRKVVFFVSDGFLLRLRETNVRDRLRRVADAAARGGAVIYSMDARGLVSGLADASSDEAFDPVGGRLSHIASSERGALQEPLFTLAEDTGGRALVNTNALDVSLKRALKETSVYYLLAWRPEVIEGRNARFRRIEVSVKDRPNLKVMVRRGFFDAPPPPVEAKRAKEKDKKSEEKTADTELLSALRSPFPQTALPTALSLGYVNTPKDSTVLTVSLEIDETALDYSGAGGAQNNARADVLGAILNEQGKSLSTFKQQLSVLPPRPESKNADRRIVYTQQVALAAGLYQVRVASRDPKSGRTGSAMEWIEIPNVSEGKFALSSIFVGEREGAKHSAAGETNENGNPVIINADRRFARNSRLRFLLHVYNAALKASTPDVALQVQVFRDDQPVVTTPLSKLNSEGFPDQARIPYAAEINLDKMPVGRYVLQINAVDRVAKAHASQRVSFTVQ